MSYYGDPRPYAPYAQLKDQLGSGTIAGGSTAAALGYAQPTPQMPPAPSPIQGALNELADSLDQLDSYLGLLAMRLAPYRRPSAPISSGDVPADPSRSEVNYRIYLANVRVQSLLVAVSELTATID